MLGFLRRQQRTPIYHLPRAKGAAAFNIFDQHSRWVASSPAGGEKADGHACHEQQQSDADAHVDGVCVGTEATSDEPPPSVYKFSRHIYNRDEEGAALVTQASQGRGLWFGRHGGG